MFWTDKFAQKIQKSGKYLPYHVDDMKTPSGRVHVGALRGMVIHGLIHQVLKENQKKSSFTFVINDMDPMDGFPHYLPHKFKKYMGYPLYKIPSPEKGYDSMAQCYAQEFIKTSRSLGIKPKIIWSSQAYQKGQFNSVIKQALNKVKLVRKLYHQISNYEKPQNWYPYQVICPKCGKVGTTIVTGWDGQKVKFTCQKNLVDWAQGCGFKGEIEPVGDHGKLMWKVDWAAHWKVINVTIEGAGKDHMTEGGSHDLSSAICQQVFNYPTPFSFIYEWFLAKGGTKMSSSKGIGVSAAEIAATLPPEILRFLLVKTPYKKAIIFDPQNNDSILDLFDDYDKCAQIYYQKGIKNDFGRAWQLSQIEKIPSKPIFLPRFRDVVNYLQSPSVNLVKQFSKIKGSPLKEPEKKELKKRIKYAKIWLKTYAPEEKVFQITQKLPQLKTPLSQTQKQFLLKVSQAVSKASSPEKLQQQVYQISKDLKLQPKKAFQTLYQVLINKTHGPKAGWLLFENKKLVLQKLQKAANI